MVGDNIIWHVIQCYDNRIMCPSIVCDSHIKQPLCKLRIMKSMHVVWRGALPQAEHGWQQHSLSMTMASSQREKTQNTQRLLGHQNKRRRRTVEREKPRERGLGGLRVRIGWGGVHRSARQDSRPIGAELSEEGRLHLDNALLQWVQLGQPGATCVNCKHMVHTDNPSTAYMWAATRQKKDVHV